MFVSMQPWLPASSGALKFFTPTLISNFHISHAIWSNVFALVIFWQNAKGTSSTQEVGAVLTQLRIEPSEKTTPRATKKEKMAANSRRRKKTRIRRYCYNYYNLIEGGNKKYFKIALKTTLLISLISNLVQFFFLLERFFFLITQVKSPAFNLVNWFILRLIRYLFDYGKKKVFV